MRSFGEPPSYVEWIFDALLRIVWMALSAIVFIALRLILTPIVYIFALPLKPIVPIVNLVAYWAGKTETRRWRIVTIGSVLISYLFLLFFMDWHVGLALMACLYLHEKFHGIGFSIAKVAYYIMSLWILGMAAIAQDEDYEKMTEWEKSVMLLLGPIGSTIAAIICWLAAQLFPLYASTWLMLAGFNMTLVLFNMVAWDGLDGGRTYKSVMYSLRESSEKYVSVPMIAFSIIVLGWVFVRTFRVELVIFFLFLMVVAFIRSTFRDNPAGYLNPKAMNLRQIMTIVTSYMLIILVGTLLYVQFPDWTPLLKVSPLVSDNLHVLIAISAMIAIWMFGMDVYKWVSKTTWGSEPKVATLMTFALMVVGVLALLVLSPLPSVSLGLSGIVGNFLGGGAAILNGRWERIHKRLLDEKPKEPSLVPLLSESD